MHAYDAREIAIAKRKENIERVIKFITQKIKEYANAGYYEIDHNIPSFICPYFLKKTERKEIEKHFKQLKYDIYVDEKEFSVSWEKMIK